jgi:hypothetical protein
MVQRCAYMQKHSRKAFLESRPTACLGKRGDKRRTHSSNVTKCHTTIFIQTKPSCYLGAIPGDAEGVPNAAVEAGLGKTRLLAACQSARRLPRSASSNLGECIHSSSSVVGLSSLGRRKRISVSIKVAKSRSDFVHSR